MMKHVIVHVGPHKTGSTAIQEFLKANRDRLLREFSIDVLINAATHELAHGVFSARKLHKAHLFEPVTEQIRNSKADHVLLSEEDFSGDLLGRAKITEVYPNLRANLETLRTQWAEFNLIFVFFVRSEEAWIKSVYRHNVFHRQKLTSFQQFRKICNADFSWAAILAESRDLLEGRLQTIEYSPDPSDGARKLLEVCSVSSAAFARLRAPKMLNRSADSELTRKYEFVNGLAMPNPRKIRLKQKIARDYNREASRGPLARILPRIKRHDRLVQERSLKNEWSLDALKGRAARRIVEQDTPDLLPELTVDLAALAFQRVDYDPNTDRLGLSRIDMRDQLKTLRYHLRERSQLALLNGLVISYLRRRTLQEKKARKLFHRIWETMGGHLKIELPSRWLISVLQTFYDHGTNEQQRLIGASGYFYGNLIKAYEAEAALEGRKPDRIYEHTAPTVKGGFDSLDRFGLGQTDLLLNVNAMAMEICERDPVAGQVLEEFVLRAKNSNNVFTRMDRSRKAHNLVVEGFEDCWSFFEEPKAAVELIEPRRIPDEPEF